MLPIQRLAISLDQPVFLLFWTIWKEICPIPRARPVLPSRPRNVHIRENTLQKDRRYNKEQVNEKLWSREINFSLLPGSCFWNMLPRDDVQCPPWRLWEPRGAQQWAVCSKHVPSSLGCCVNLLSRGGPLCPGRGLWLHQKHPPWLQANSSFC